MYYAAELFIKKGALGTIWLAGTLWRKLNKKVVLESNIVDLCGQVKDPPIPLAISTSSKLLFGLVRMHEYRVTIVLKEANESYIKLHVYRTNRNINLQGTQLAANTEAITMVERPLGHLQDLEEIDIEMDLKEPDFMESAILGQTDHHLLAPDEAITMPDFDTSTRVKPRGLNLGLGDLGDLGDLDIELDLDIDEELDEQEAADLEISADSSLPQPIGTSGSERMDLPDLTASAEPHLPTPPSLLDPQLGAVPPIPGAPPIPSDQVSVGSAATPPPSHLDVGAVPMMQPVSSDERRQSPAEIPTQRPVPSDRDDADRTRIRRPRRKKKGRRGTRFARDEVVEFEDSELRWNEDDEEEMGELTVPRPLMRHIEDRVLAPGEFEQLFRSSLTGIYADGVLRDGFSEFADMILNPRLESQRRRKDEQDTEEMLPIPRMDVDEPQLPEPMDPLDADIPRLGDLSMDIPEIGRAEPSGLAVPSIASSVERSDSDLFAGYRLGDIAVSSSSAIPLVLPEDRRSGLDESAQERDVGMLEMGDLSGSEDVEPLRGPTDERGRRRIKGLKGSSEELTVPPELSKLTAFFKYILDGEIRKLEAERGEESDDEEEEEPVKVDLEEMLRFHAQKNGSMVRKRDMALGFISVLILKNEDIIDVEQEESFSSIYLSKGPDFNAQIVS